MQNKIAKPSCLLNNNGQLMQKGYASCLILKYRKKDVKAKRLRLKEWDYYLIYNDKFAVALTVGYSVIIGLISASFIDFTRVKENTKTVVTVFPLGKINMPESSQTGDIIYKDLKVNLSIKHEQKLRNLQLEMKSLDKNSNFKIDILLSKEPKDSMVIATPFKEDKKDFYYNQKIIGMRAIGKVCYKDRVYEFEEDNSFGLLDWGRGVWPYKTTWYWSAAQGEVDGKVFGFNLGYGFGDTSAATENMLFYDGAASKLERVRFLIPINENNEYDYLKPWRFTSSDHRFEMEFTPILDRNVNLSAIVLSTEQHQVFGKFNGRAVLDDGIVIKIKDFLGFGERVENRW
jgi:hypothetical protein